MYGSDERSTVVGRERPAVCELPWRSGRPRPTVLSNPLGAVVDFLIPVALFVLLFTGMVVFWQGFHVGEPLNEGADAAWYGRATRRRWTNSTRMMPPDVQRHRVRSMIVGAALIVVAVILGVLWSASI